MSKLIFVYRSDLETLMGSKKVHDWINLSEMLLGPVAPSFSFEPKVLQDTAYHS